tara:strand:- start:750 stop:1088 length:339 start_codon:yes stop_codon:yes gene_type:complete
MINHRPWGTYEVLLDEPDYKVKRIIVNPHQQFSLQYHNNREEHWAVVGGSGTILVGEMLEESFIGSFWVIPRKTLHRATAGPAGLTFIETQVGDCYEEDIVRLEDDYGRLEK